MDLFSALKPKNLIFIGLILLTLLLLVFKLTAKFAPGQVLPSPSPARTPQTTHFPLAAAERGDPTYYEEIGEKLGQRFPLYRFLPWETESYTLKYLGPLKLEIDLKTASASAKNEAWEWIESKGVATKSHEIIFK